MTGSCAASIDAEWIIRVAQGLSTPALAGLGLYIAWQQYSIAKRKLKLELYERRYRVFRGLMNLLASIAQDGDVSHEALGTYYAETGEKRFLFDTDLLSYLTLIRENAVELRQLNRRINPTAKTPENERDKLIEKETDLQHWFDEQIDEAYSKFEKYLSVKEIH